MLPVIEILINGFKVGAEILVPILILLLLSASMGLVSFGVIYRLPVKKSLLALLSFATAPLAYGFLALVLSTLNIPFNPVIYIAPPCFAFCLWFKKLYTWLKHRSYQKFKLQSRYFLFIACLLFISLMQLGWQHAIVLPSYVDSVQHTVLSKALISEQSLPQTLPDAPDSGLVYHFGVHALTAATYFASQTQILPEQIFLALNVILLNSFAISIYAFARCLGCYQSVSISVVLFACFAFSMPAQLLNWGKYPLLLALSTFLPVLLLFILSLNKPSDWFARLWIGLLMASMLIAHTRMLFIWAIIAVVVALVRLYYVRSIKQWFVDLMPYAFGLFFVLIFWMYPAWSVWLTPGRTSDVYAESLTIPDVLPPEPLPMKIDNSPSTPISWWDRLKLYPLQASEYLWALLIILGIALTGFRYIWLKIWILLSIVVLFLITVIKLPYVPGGHLIDATWLYAMLVIPFSLGLAVIFRSLQATGVVHDRTNKIMDSRKSITEQVKYLIRKENMNRTILSLLAFSVPCLILAGLSSYDAYASDCCLLATEYDIDAYQWIRENTDQDSIFAISANDWISGDVVGVDGGYWITVMTGRETTIPSLFYGFAADVVQYAVESRALMLDAAIRDGLDLCAWDIDYVYTGSHLNSFQVNELLSHDQLVFRYQKGTTAIFEVAKCS